MELKLLLSYILQLEGNISVLANYCNSYITFVIKEVMALLGSKIKQLREERGITSQELAECANVSQPYISQIENNRRQPSYNTLQAIAYALNTSLDYFLADTDLTTSTANPTDAPADSLHTHPEPHTTYPKPASGWVVRETINLTTLVDYAMAIDNARRANITPEEVYEAVEALKKLKHLRR